MSQRFTLALTCLATLVPVAATVFTATTAPAAAPIVLPFRGVDYVHRWSKAGQNEFTPRAEADLQKWNDMLTVNLHDKVHTGEELAQVANSVLTNYQRHGKILRTNSKPRTATREAEHLIAAVLGNPGFLEAAFVRCVIIDGTAYAAVYSHRVYGANAGPAMSQWLQANGPQVEAALMAWDKLPAAATLRALPQSK